MTLMVLYGILSGFIVISNIILIIGIIKTRTSKAMTNTNKMFIFLSCVDLLTATLLLPYQIYMIEITPNMTCIDTAVRTFFSSFLPILSGETIVLIAAERYFLIGHKLMHRLHFSPQRLLIYVFVTVAISGGWGLAYCFVSQQTDMRQSAIIFIGMAVYEGVLLIMGLVFNIKILRTVVNARRNSTLSRSNKKTERKLSRTIAIICAILTLCYIPSVVGLANASYYIHTNNRAEVASAMMTLYYTFLLATLNSGLNSAVYVVRNDKIKTYLCGGQKDYDYKNQHNKSMTSTGKNSIALKKISIASVTSTKEKHRRISAASATLEIKNGVLVPKTRRLERQDRIEEEKNDEKEMGKQNLGLEE